MAATLHVYANAIKNGFIAGLDWDTNAIKMGLLTSYTPDEDHETWTAVKAAGAEHANANGYTTGGATLTSKTNVCSGGVTTFESDDVSWLASGDLTAKYACCYDSVTDKVLFYINLNGGADFTAYDGNDLTITNPSGWFSINVSP